ncbi:MAG: hypothetical protein JWM02_3305 [Frankiales bacterium]|nr:hypothetical protein [Frankiales bacterium]
MSEAEGKPARRLRALRSRAAGEVTRETAETVLPDLPRVGALDALLREIDGLRLSLETDLSLAASAVEAGAPGIAADIIDGERDGLRAFESRALSHLSDLAEPVAKRNWWALLPAAPFVAAAAVVGFLIGVVPHDLGSTPTRAPTTQVSASQSLAQLTELATSGQTSKVRSAAVALHSQLMALVARAKTDPAAAQQGLLLLRTERAVIAQSGDSQALGDVLAASTRLSNLITEALPAAVRTVPTPPPFTLPLPTSRPATKPSSNPTSKPATTSTTKPATKASSSAKPRPSSSPSGPGVLPTSANLAP